MPPRRNLWGEWSNWEWDATRVRYWRAREDNQGNVEFQYEPYSHDTAGQAEQAAPRGNADDDLADALSGVNLGGQDAAYTQEGAYTHNPPVVADGSSVAFGTYPAQNHGAFPGKGRGKAADPSGKSKPRGYKDVPKDKAYSHKKHRSRPERSYVEGYAEDPAAAYHDPFYQKTSASSNPDYESSPPSHTASMDPQALHDPGFGAPSHAASIDARPPHDPGFGAPSHASAFRSGLSQTSGAHYTYDQTGPPVHQRAEARFSDQGQYGRRDRASGRGTRAPTDRYDDPPPEQSPTSYYAPAPEATLARDEPSELQAAISEADPYHTGAPPASYPEGGTSSMATAHSYPYEPPYGLDSGQRTPRPSAQQGTEVVHDYPSYLDSVPASVSTGREPDLQDEYVVEHSSRFRPGEVFKIYWCEPLGAGTTPRSVITQNFGLQERNGQRFYQGLRRFIVVANDEGHCTCVPILTYEHKACTKRGVKPLKHGIVYQVGKKPRMVDGEPDLGFYPVRVALNERSEKLDKESRVNYAKLTTVEHNFPVLFIGRVITEDFTNIVSPAVDMCWTRKRRH